MEREGFTTKEGLWAIGGLIGACILGIIGFGKRVPLTIIFLSLMSLFFGIYGKKLCVNCKKSCPCNPDLYFWKQAFKECIEQKETTKETA